jgi:hypothetical protein
MEAMLSIVTAMMLLTMGVYIVLVALGFEDR